MRKSLVRSGVVWGLALGVLSMAVAAVGQTPGASTFLWATTDTGFGSGGGSGVVVELRNGVWPVIATEDSVIGLQPFRNPQTNGFYHELLLSPFGVSFGDLRAAASSSGMVAFTQNLRLVGDNEGRSAGVFSTATGSFVPMPDTVVAADYDIAGNLVTASRDAVAGYPGYPFEPGGLVITDLAISPFGQVLALNENYELVFFDPQLGWNVQPLSAPPFGPFFFLGAQGGSVEFDSNGVPHMAAFNVESRQLITLSFDVPSAQYVLTELGESANLSGAVAIAANDFGVVGVSYIDADRNLRYGFKSGLDPWATVIVDQDVEGGTQPGLAYDAAGLPVISYVDSENNIIVAYDPVGSIAPAPVLLDGDANGDGVVDLLDFDVLAQNFGAGPGFPDGLSAGDFNADGVVDLLDFDILAQNFGSSSPAVVPVPGSVGLMGLGVAGLMRCRRP